MRNGWSPGSECPLKREVGGGIGGRLSKKKTEATEAPGQVGLEDADASRGSAPSLVDEDRDQEPATALVAPKLRKKKKSKKQKKKTAAEETWSTPLGGFSPLDESNPLEESPEGIRKKKKKGKKRPGVGVEVDADQETTVDHASETVTEARPKKKRRRNQLRKSNIRLVLRQNVLEWLLLISRTIQPAVETSSETPPCQEGD